MKHVENIDLLIVEDNEHDIFVLHKTLENQSIKESGLHFHVTECTSAEDALKIIEQNDKSFGVLLVDYKLPGKCGLEFCEIILKKNIEIPIVLLTGLGTIDTAVKAIKLGVSDYIVKDNTLQYLEFLPYTLRNAYLKQKEINARREAEAKIEKYAKELEKINHYKELFTDIMRHDLLNIATTIAVGASWFVEDIAEEEKLEASSMVQEMCKQLIVVIQNAAKFSNLEDISELDFEKISINKHLSLAIENIKPVILEKNITIKNLSQKEIEVTGNPLLTDVFSNLLLNAIKYAPEAKEIETHITENEESCVISVKDFGEGVEDKYKESIFHRFERLDKQGIQGTGLGLAICKRIVELHNGTIWVEDNPSGGAVFKVNIPKERR